MNKLNNILISKNFDFDLITPLKIINKLFNKLSITEKELGGIPNSSEDIKQAHASAIESYIENYVGRFEDGEHGNMYFQRTLQDWSKFNINNRTKYDASISSGLAIMACQKYLKKHQKMNYTAFSVITPNL